VQPRPRHPPSAACLSAPPPPKELGNPSEVLHFDTVHSGRLSVRRAPPPPAAAPGGGAEGAGAGGPLLEMRLPWSPPSDALPAGLLGTAGGGGGGGSRLNALAAASTGGLGVSRLAAVGFNAALKYFVFQLPEASRAGSAARKGRRGAGARRGPEGGQGSPRPP
jgi:hypothetical protein